MVWLSGSLRLNLDDRRSQASASRPGWAGQSRERPIGSGMVRKTIARSLRCRRRGRCRRSAAKTEVGREPPAGLLGRDEDAGLYFGHVAAETVPEGGGVDFLEVDFAVQYLLLPFHQVGIGVIVTELVGEFDLGDGVLVELMRVAGVPGRGNCGS
jgi:hypothetical protein